MESTPAQVKGHPRKEYLSTDIIETPGKKNDGH
jgi:hypothetical protein